jgi:adenosylcobinamide kinase/adenosylcobinamide-phosphate guanylyltransferase
MHRAVRGRHAARARLALIQAATYTQPRVAESRIILVGGGVRSGKSAFALRRARELGTRRVFVATAQVLDAEMDERVAAHRRERGDDFRSVEAPRELVAALRAIDAADVMDVVVVDCLTLWLSNLLLDGLDRERIEQRVCELCDWLGERRRHCVLVGNEVGLGIVPDNPLARAFRDVSGRAHQLLGARADEIYLGLFGQLLRLRPGPVEALSPGP